MNLKEIAKMRGTNLKQVAEKCGVPASTLYAISSGDTNFEKVGIGLFIQIADALNMTPDELYGRNTEPKEGRVPINPDEEELVMMFRCMRKTDREIFINLARSLARAGGNYKNSGLGSELMYHVVNVNKDGE